MKMNPLDERTNQDLGIAPGETLRRHPRLARVGFLGRFIAVVNLRRAERRFMNQR